MESANEQSKELENKQSTKEFDAANEEVSEKSVTKMPKKVLVESTVESLNTLNTPKIVVKNKNMKNVSNTRAR